MRSCPLCQTAPAERRKLHPRDYEYGTRFDGALDECSACALLFVDPLPSEADLPGFYPAGYTSYAEDAKSINALMIRRYYGAEARRFAKILPEGGALLDVGCGEGTFLDYLRRKGAWKLFGLEIDPRAVEKGRAKELSLLAGSPESLHFPEGSFDVIRLNHVIEHLRMPSLVLETACKLLKPGGVLIGETPNFECLDFRLFGRYWGGIHFPRHLHLFSRRSIARMAADAGFAVEEIRFCSRPLGWSAGIQNVVADILRIPPKNNGRYFWYPFLVALFLPVTWIQKLFRRSGVMEFHLRKPIREALP